MYIEDYCLTLRRVNKVGNSVDLHSKEFFESLQDMEPADHRRYVYSVCRGEYAISDIVCVHGRWVITPLSFASSVSDQIRVRHFLEKIQNVS